MSDVSSTHAWGLTRIQEIGLMQGCSSDFESASLSHLSFSCVRVFFFKAKCLANTYKSGNLSCKLPKKTRYI